MARAENFFQVAKESGKQGLVYLPDRSIPLKWLSHPIVTPLFEKTAPKVMEEVPDTLKYDRVSDAVSNLLSQDGLTTTIRSLFPKTDVEVNGVNAMTVQMGKKAYIILCQAENTVGKGYFAIYLGRNPNDSKLGNEAERDFYNLSDLSDTAEQRLTDKAKRKYKFLKPISLMEPIKVDGHKYSSFTMPFINDYGELRADVYEGKKTPIRFPFFRYSVVFSKALKSFNDSINKRNSAIEDKLIHLAKRFPDKPLEYILTQLTKTSGLQAIKKQMEELLIGNALIYLLSDGHFPKDFMVNSGDWMVNFVNDSLYLFLITIRGGWKKLAGEENWQERMRQQDEVVPGREMEGVTMPLFYGQDDLILTAIGKAKELLKK